MGRQNRRTGHKKGNSRATRRHRDQLERSVDVPTDPSARRRLLLLAHPAHGKRRREALELQSKIGPGDEVQTVGGLYGTVTDVDDESVTLEAAPGVHLRFLRGAIAKVNVSHAKDATADDADDEDEPADGNADTAKAID